MDVLKRLGVRGLWSLVTVPQPAQSSPAQPSPSARGIESHENLYLLLARLGLRPSYLYDCTGNICTETSGGEGKQKLREKNVFATVCVDQSLYLFYTSLGIIHFLSLTCQGLFVMWQREVWLTRCVCACLIWQRELIFTPDESLSHKIFMWTRDFLKVCAYFFVCVYKCVCFIRREKDRVIVHVHKLRCIHEQVCKCTDVLTLPALAGFKIWMLEWIGVLVCDFEPCNSRP